MHADTPTLEPAAFVLRCRDGEWIDRPATLDEFARPAPLPSQARHAGLSEVLIADAIARAHYEIGSLAGGRVIVSCETPRFGIPLGVQDLDRAPVEQWNHVEQLDGELIDRDHHGRIERSLAMQVRRGLIAVAGALPLLASPMLAHASGPELMHAPSLELLAGFAPPKTAAPKLPEEPAEPEPAPAAEPAPTPETTTTAPPVVTPPAAPPPRVESSLSLTGSALWDGLLGQQVRLDMKDGQGVSGVVVAQTATDLALARTPDGTVVAVPKSEVAGVRMRVAVEGAGGPGGSNVPVGDRPLQDGRGLNAGGIVMVTLGSIAALSGTVMLAISPYYLFISLPLLLPGLAMIGGGSAMISAAGKKKRAFDAAWGVPKSARIEVMPTLAGGRNGGGAGLILKF